MNKYNNAIIEMINILEKEHLSFPLEVSKEELNDYVNIVLGKNINNDYDFNYYANNIIKYALNSYDSHTKLACTSFSKNKLPIKLKVINNKLYIIDTYGYDNIKYKKIVHINDIEINKLIKEIDFMTCSSTKEHLCDIVESSFVYPESLRCLESINNDCKNIKIDFSDNSNIVFDANKEYPKLSEIKNYSYEINENIIIIHINKCTLEYPDQIIDLISELKEKEINNYIIDIRGNGGGDDTIFNPLIQHLKDKNIITLVDNKVYSSGRHLLMYLKQIGSKTIGTGISTSLNSFGARKRINLESLDNYRLNITTKYLYFDDNLNMLSINSKDDLNKLDKDIFKPQIFKPDIYVENSIDDYRNGVDKQLEVAINEFRKKDYYGKI